MGAKLDKLVLKTVLWPGYYSDMATGAASIDPLFWVMHQMFDKATHALRLSPVYNAGKMEWNNGGDDSSQGLGWNATTPFTSAIFEPFIGDKVVANKEGYLTNKVIWSLLSPVKASTATSTTSSPSGGRATLIPCSSCLPPLPRGEGDEGGGRGNPGSMGRRNN